MWRRIGMSAAVALGLAAVPWATAEAQVPPCHPFPLFWPVCAAAAVVGTAANIVTAPIRAAVTPYPYWYGRPYYYPPAAYYAPRYYAPPYYAPAYYYPYR